MNFKKIYWSGDDPVCHITSYTKVFGKHMIAFTIMSCADGNLRLIDNTDDYKSYVVRSVEAGKDMAQLLFESYCEEIIKNIIK